LGVGGGLPEAARAIGSRTNSFRKVENLGGGLAADLQIHDWKLRQMG
jgi:hypothetical protein